MMWERTIGPYHIFFIVFFLALMVQAHPHFNNVGVALWEFGNGFELIRLWP